MSTLKIYYILIVAVVQTGKQGRSICPGSPTSATLPNKYMHMTQNSLHHVVGGGDISLVIHNS
jgi:hypothetical protein